MPYTAEHKQRTRARIVEAARALFNDRGFVEVSIDDVMAEAGLTRGGFYNHFRNKTELLVAAVEAFAECNPTEHWEGVELDYNAPSPERARQLANAYLSEQHLEDVAGHCPLVALPADIARAGPELREAYRGLLERMINIYAGDNPDAADRERGMALTALCVGAMLIGRTVDDRDFGKQMLAAARNAAQAGIPAEH